MKINNTDIRLRPSTIDGFFGCAYQWGLTFLEGRTSRPNSRAAIGTGIHAAAEVFWQEAIKTGDKKANKSTMTDAAVQAFKEEQAKDLKYGDGENENTCTVEMVKGTEAFIEDIVPFAQIPKAVEEFYEVKLDHPLVSSIGGTVDYITDTTIADLKTSKRKPTVSNYVTQQSIYKYLAQENGVKVEHNLIQSVVLKKVPDGAIIGMDANVPQAKRLVNSILDTLDLVVKDVAPIETILRGNPKYNFCSDKWCDHYKDCPFSAGKLEAEPQAQKIKL